MPELPDVAVYKRYIDATALHHSITTTRVFDDGVIEGVTRATLQRNLKDRSFSGTRRHGKHLFVHLDDERWMRVHFGMTGSVRYYKASDDTPDGTRIRWDFDNGFHLAFVCPRKFGRIALLDDPEAFIADRGLGPDARDALDEEQLADRLDGRRGTIKATLINQHVVAGIGNIYADEILFQTRLHPTLKAGSLDAETVSSIFHAMQHVLATAIEHGADPEALPDSFLLPHRYGDGACPACGGSLEHIKVSGRTTYFCPSCQPKP